eukprot:COSAG02_NODE_32872_length_509_cov_0.824390_2_plen_41_part_01
MLAHQLKFGKDRVLCSVKQLSSTAGNGGAGADTGNAEMERL